jgi:hypothetical protein
MEGSGYKPADTTEKQTKLRPVVFLPMLAVLAYLLSSSYPAKQAAAALQQAALLGLAQQLL